MSLHNVPYYFATCAGKSGNIFNPRCLTQGPGSFEEVEAIHAAEDLGWKLGKNNYCPAHADQAPAAADDTSPAKPRRSRKATPADTPAGAQIPLENHE